jgi:hypothetical protein
MALAHGLNVVGPAHEPFWPTSSLGRHGIARSRGHHTQRAWGGALFGVSAVSGRWEGAPLEYEGASGLAPSKEGRPVTHCSSGATVGGRGDGGRQCLMTASGLGWVETSSGRSCSMRPMRGGEGKVHSMGGGSEAWLTERGSRRWRRLQIRRRRRCSGQPERTRGRGGWDGARGMRGKEKSRGGIGVTTTAWHPFNRAGAGSRAGGYQCWAPHGRRRSGGAWRSGRPATARGRRAVRACTARCWTGEGGGRWPMGPRYSPMLRQFEFVLVSNSKRVQIWFKLFWTLTNQKMTFVSLNFLK